ncbi:NADH:ubiquinone reductase (Na(+)-transporting) subunit A [Bosea sp. (in: a-proteobacteria)]|uniref:NADH:ubiquinone reductase (Na(+)-transporting) subunit A n=1 Tax=Bosea sp. (in: a-proteobacteria) TaxID=1871050 RepID=UPI002625DD03|nr:NADH:ubiquinone reductase (Na(+)-transporting) subunit A [Bosea sp. (in: a-proteobacteria)]MCO5093580.1 NADH:ubiquinone reductase (Na(+)-transporting) subunit A [Bosea sp. (in: a-proteobacteria)]
MTRTRCRGIDLFFAGQAVQAVVPHPLPRHLALVGEDYPGLRPRFAVSEGDRVAAGDLLFTDRRRPGSRHVAPASGIVAEIRKGGRQSLDRVVIALDEGEARAFAVPAALESATLRALLIESGAWQAIRTRPFDDVPEPEATPDAIFVTAIDTRPLAPDPAVVIARHRAWFARGLKALTHLGAGAVHLCHRAGVEMPAVPDVRPAGFTGPHPAGLAGTHIHYLHPVEAGGACVWHIGYQEVIAIGHLLETGRIWARRVVALAGDGLSAPRLIETVPGAELRALCGEGLVEGAVRIRSGSPLDGRADAYLARGHLQVTVERQAHGAAAGSGLLARLRTFLAVGGSAIIPNAAHERAAPPGVLPIPLLRALSVGDVETARQLGALGLAEEDMALLSHVDGGRTDFGALLRRALDELRDAA